MNADTAYHLIKGLFSKSYSGDWLLMIRHWLASDDSVAARDEALAHAWEEVAGTADEAEVERQLAVVHKQMEERENARQSRRRLVYRVLRYAAMIALPLLAAWFTWTYSSRYHAQRYAMQTLVVPDGETARVTLTDGTVIRVNGGSMLVYPRVFNRWTDRNVYLSGEAHFAVARDEEHPFHVHIGDIDVRVHGTRFNVRAYQGDETVTTTLESGSVSMVAPDCTMKLRPGEQVEYRRETHQLQKYKVDTQNARAWTDGALVFVQTPLEEVLSTLTHKYGVKFRVEESIDLSRRYNVNFVSTEKLDAILGVIMKMSGDMSYTMSGGEVTLRKEEPMP